MATPTKKLDAYTEAVGRRKTSVARVRITPAKKTEFTVNDRAFHDYFPTEELRSIIKTPLVISERLGNFTVSVHVNGGGIHSQSEALRLGLSRALLKFNAEERGPLKAAALLSRDSRSKERRKFGLKKARKAPQWSKR